MANGVERSIVLFLNLTTVCQCKLLRQLYWLKAGERIDFFIDYRIYSRISRPAYKPTPIPASDNLAKTSDLRISR